MRRALSPPSWPPERGADEEVVTLTLVSGPITHPDDAAFPGIVRHRMWVRWFDDRTGWRTHVMFSITALVARYWRHAGRVVVVVDASNARAESRLLQAVSYYQVPRHLGVHAVPQAPAP